MTRPRYSLALCGKHPGDLGTDAGTAAGDQGTLSDEFQIHADRLQGWKGQHKVSYSTHLAFGRRGCQAEQLDLQPAWPHDNDPSRRSNAGRGAREWTTRATIGD